MHALTTQSGPLALSTHDTPDIVAPDVVALLLADKRSECTRRAYAGDLADFFQGDATAKGEPTPDLVSTFLSLPAPQIALALARYKSTLRERGLSEATINRRLAALKSLLKFAHRLGLCSTDGRGLIDGEKVKSYRDTRGVDLKMLKKLLAAPAKIVDRKIHTQKNFAPKTSHSTPVRTHNSKCTLERMYRDTALLKILIENALRRAEVCALDVGDFDPVGKSLWITGKGRGSQKERITLSASCVAAIAEYLECAGHAVGNPSGEGALFRNLDHRPEYSGQRLTADGLYQLVGFYGRLVGLKRLTPHMLRHSAITALSTATNGNLVKIQGFSRHAKIETVRRYVDNANDTQGEMSNLLSGLLK